MRKILFISMCMPFEKAFHAGGKTFNYYINKFANDSANEVTLIAKVFTRRGRICKRGKFKYRCILCMYAEK